MSSVLEVLERRIGLEGLTERLRTRGTDAVVIEAAVVTKEERGEASRGIDSKDGQAGSVLERGEGLVESEPLRESLGALRTELVEPEAAKERRGAMSKGIDSEEGQAGSVLERGEGLVESKAL